MNDRPRPQAPRTLSATPPPATRAPSSTRYVTRFPALAVALASGAVIPACHPPECRSTRADELESHGLRALDDVRSGHGGDALTEIGVALGVAEHSAAQTRVLAAGQMPQTTPTPPQTPPPQITPPSDVDGGIGEVSPLPTTVPHTPPNAQSTQATQHPPPNATAPAEPHITAPGRVRRVTPRPRSAPPTF